jgi:hypothetical protein
MPIARSLLADDDDLVAGRHLHPRHVDGRHVHAHGADDEVRVSAQSMKVRPAIRRSRPSATPRDDRDRRRAVEHRPESVAGASPGRILDMHDTTVE